MRDDSKRFPLGGPAWLRSIAAWKAEMINCDDPESSGDMDIFEEDVREVQGLRDAADRMEKMEQVLLELEDYLNSSYDFDNDPDRLAMKVSEVLG